MKEEEEAEEEDAESVTDLAEAADLDASLESLDERPACSLPELGKNDEDEEDEDDEDTGRTASAFLRFCEVLGAGQEPLFLFSVLLGGVSEGRRRFLDLRFEVLGAGVGSGVESASSDCSEFSGGGALGRLAGLGE